MSSPSLRTASVATVLVAVGLFWSPTAQSAGSSDQTRGITVRERLPPSKPAPPAAAAPATEPRAPAEAPQPSIARPAAPPTPKPASDPGVAGRPADHPTGETSITSPAPAAAPQPDVKTAAPVAPAAPVVTPADPKTAAPVPPAAPVGRADPPVPDAGTTANVGTSPGVVTGPGNVQVSTNNPAGLRLDLNGGGTFKVGDKLVVKVSAQRPGYLVIMDIAADGRITQIYPNVISLVGEGQKAGEANLLKAGGSVLVPDPDSPLTNFDFVAAPPLGAGLLVAMLSDKPVQIVDLPDVPPAAQKLDYVQQATRSLRITPAGGGPLLDPKWSFDAKAYTITE